MDRQTGTKETERRGINKKLGYKKDVLIGCGTGGKLLEMERVYPLGSENVLGKCHGHQLAKCWQLINIDFGLIRSQR